MNEQFAKLNFVAAMVCFAIALLLALFVPEVEANTRIAFFYAGVLCIAAGLFFRS